MLQTLSNTTSSSNNGSSPSTSSHMMPYFNPKKQVLSKWCNSHVNMGGILTTTTTTSSTTTTTTSTMASSFSTTTSSSSSSAMNTANTAAAAATTMNSGNQFLVNHSSGTWNVEYFDNNYFYSNNLKLNVDVVLTHSREDTSCLEPSIDPSTGQNKGIVLYSSLRYQLRHCLKLSPSSPKDPCSLPPLLFMKVVLIGGTTKEDIGGVISPSTEHPVSVTERVFASENRVQIEKVQSYKQLVHFKISLYDLRDLNKAICELKSVEFNVFARKKQESAPSSSSTTTTNNNNNSGSLSPKTTKKTKNPSTKRSLTSSDATANNNNTESLKRQKACFDGSISNNQCYNSISYSTSGVMNDLSFVSDHTTSSHLLVSANHYAALNTLINIALPSAPQKCNHQEEEDDDTPNLKIDDGEEDSTTSLSPSPPSSPPSNDDILLSQFCTLLNDMIQSVKSLNEQDRTTALQTAMVALR
ncbi:hypothetical protein C9374_002278 [Naegleria lovaniensis]|uniref:Uncharacterized protein n=1 Tax=Naegleria lovaniensis TaxID=51637 RepID=A0AA88GUT0_NAELO|nr:uncharacterized protein C9374_002278 [Naegleria lovaniensis]KAG2386534.1 hypothetical protein C9374_002278 [Naegleria lovaniensis]